MPKRVYTFTILLPYPRRAGDTFYLTGFLDMLRHDGARVLHWEQDTTRFVVTLETDTYNPDRWASMGLAPKEGDVR